MAIADGTAGWTIAGSSATAGTDVPDCPDDTPAKPAEVTGHPVHQPGTGSGVGTPAIDPPEGGACEAGERETDSDCVPVEPVDVLLVDNYLTCNGLAVAVFAAHNPNSQTITVAEGESTLDSALDGTPPTSFEPDRVIDGAREATTTFAVHYGSAVTWTVEHDGWVSRASAGHDHARLPADECSDGPTTASLTTTGGPTDPSTGADTRDTSASGDGSDSPSDVAGSGVAGDAQDEGLPNTGLSVANAALFGALALFTGLALLLVPGRRQRV